VLYKLVFLNLENKKTILLEKGCVCKQRRFYARQKAWVRKKRFHGMKDAKNNRHASYFTIKNGQPGF